MWLLLMPLLATAMEPVPLLPEEYRGTQKQGNDTYAHTFMIPMRDGVELETVVFTTDPDILLSYSDNSVNPHKVVLERSPYNLQQTFAESVAFVALFDYISVIQNFRGRYNSQGEYDLFASEAFDSHDTRQWIIKQPWCEGGHVMAYGISADGISAALSIAEPHEEVTAGFYALATGNLHRLIMPQGAVKWALFEGWLKGLHEQKWVDITLNNTEYYNNSFYDYRSIYQKANATNVNFPALFMSGWYDIMQNCTIGLYDEFKAAIDTPETPRVLVVGPFGHCQFLKPLYPLGRGLYLSYFEAAVQLNNDRIAGKITEFPMKLEKTKQTIDKVNLYVMDGIRSYWTSLPDWPPFEDRAYYLNSNGALGTKANSAKDSTKYIYDPNDPTPSHGGNNLEIDCGPLDQTDVDKHSGVITFETPVLDSDVVVCGHMYADLYVSSNCTDTDFMVKIEDVSAWDAALLMDNALSMKWRKGMEVPYSPIEPNEIYNIMMDLWYTCKVFEAGHKIRVAISSSNYPRFMATGNNGLLANETGPVLIAENTIHHGPEYPSRLILPIVDIDELPNNHHFL